MFDKRVRKFDTALQAALFPDNIPTAVYKQLLADVHRSLPTLHRYLALRKRMLGLDTLRYQDLYVPLVASVDMHFGPDEARVVVAHGGDIDKFVGDALMAVFQGAGAACRAVESAVEMVAAVHEARAAADRLLAAAG